MSVATSAKYKRNNGKSDSCSAKGHLRMSPCFCLKLFKHYPCHLLRWIHPYNIYAAPTSTELADIALKRPYCEPHPLSPALLWSTSSLSSSSISRLSATSRSSSLLNTVYPQVVRSKCTFGIGRRPPAHCNSWRRCDSVAALVVTRWRSHRLSDELYTLPANKFLSSSSSSSAMYFFCSYILSFCFLFFRFAGLYYFILFLFFCIAF